MDLEGYADKIERLHSFVKSKPELAHLAPSLADVLSQARGLAKGERPFAVISPRTGQGVPSRELAVAIMEILDDGPDLTGIWHDLELRRAYENIETNLVWCLVNRIMRDYPDVIRKRRP